MAATSSDDALVDALVQSAFGTTAVLQRIAAEHDLSLTQLRVLAILRDRRLRIGDLATYLGLERSTLSGLVDRAVARGLVQRLPGRDDQRVVEVTLTSAGGELGERIQAAVGDALAPLTQALSAAERDRLQHLLRRLLERGPRPEGQSAQASSTGR
ncbi:MarR family winged helix-turn-helix transcriptional regulator [Jatrophihabitans sp. YIM 134969]